jgi:hypothetical protein
MKLSRALAGVSFIGALAIGMGAAYIAAFGSETETIEVVNPPQVQVTYKLAPPPVYRHSVTVSARDLRGTWEGTWGYDNDPCTIEIKKVDGDRVYGTLYKEEAVISVAGEFDAEEQRLLLRETKVVSVGSYSEWSLGTNTGTFSHDGLTLSGTGIDKWGTYDWSVTKK